MPNPRVLLLPFLLAMPSVQAEPSLAEQARYANEQIAAYHANEPVKSERKLRVAYFLPSDREPAPQYRERLTRVLDETAAFYEQQISGHGLKARRLPIDRDADGLVRCILVHGKESWTVYNTKEPISGVKVREECLPVLRAAGIDPTRETVAVFTAIMEWDGDKRRFRQRSPYQGGGTARSGFCWQIDSPVLDPKNIPEKAPIIDDGEYGMVSLGKWNSMFVGGVIHELGHSFGLPHNAQRPSQADTLGTSLMGSGNRTFGEDRRGEGRGSFLTFADALRLVSHPLFSGYETGLWDEKAGPAVFEHLSVNAYTTFKDGRNTLRVSGHISSQIPVYGIVAYIDGEGGSDYDAIASTTVPDAEGNFTVRCGDLPKNKGVELRLAALQVNGMVSTERGLRFHVTAEGHVEMEDLRQQLVLAPILAALRVGRGKEAARLTSALPKTEPAKKLALPTLTPPAQRPESIPANAKEVSLCDLRPTNASVGWRQPAFNYSPEDLTILVGGKVVTHGIYAHAPSSYTWTLDGTWPSFHARCTLRDEYDGSVEFIVKGNGIEKWRSGILKRGMSKDCKVDMSGVTTLELIVTNGGDDSHQDHGFWIAPMLQRD